jgi:tetratricopeptide (TPR) repeat protein
VFAKGHTPWVIVSLRGVGNRIMVALFSVGHLNVTVGPPFYHGASAETAFATVLELAPQSTNAWVGLGTVYKALGRFDEAAAAFRKALKISPDNVNALNHLTVVGRATDSDLAALTNQLAHGRLNDEDSIEAEFAIGKQLDDANRYNQAFAHYARGNMLAKQICRSEGRSFERATFESLVDQQIQTFNPDFFKRLLEGGNASETPVFIVGMPRSGTTLTEQILASHSKVFGAGELRDISNIAITTPDPKTWDSMTIRHQAESHLRRLVERAPGSERVVDKMPGNIFHLGLIGALFPNARVIFCRRDPRDNCLSCYFQWFSDNGFSFSYDLADCGTQWKAQERLEKHFLQNLPLRMTVVQYETLVADLEGESRRLIDFLGLEWESQCLEFHKTKRSVSTASVWQVRQPLYSSSVGRWKHYEKHLGPLLTELAK